ncbi:MAG TPA: class I SAM-dependent methyltransferase [Anaerolineales bacterium]|nr:class I SAM-dependent methyltransferase [Anaerolineales bacterium]
MLDLDAVDIGFSRKAEVYDTYCENHPVIRWAREKVRLEVIQYLQADDSILELNAGTGTDAAYFVQQGYRVHATDIASGMLSAIQNKIRISNAVERFTAQQLSFTELSQVGGAPYDLIFSNFGGLNCIPDLRIVTKSLYQLLKPGGHLVWVIMPPICPWEVAQALRGQIRLATRRLNRNGILANVEGARVMTWYHRPKKVMASFTQEFQLINRQALSLFCPPSYMDKFPHRFPRLTSFLLQLDGNFGGRAPFYNWGDFVAYTFRYEA